MLTHGSILGVSSSHGKLATGLEHIGALGWPIFPRTCSVGQKVSPMKPHLQKLKSHQQKVLAGRAVYMPCLARWFMYILGNVMRVEKASPTAPLQSCIDDDDDDNI